jgi:hypothetical protein
MKLFLLLLFLPFTVSAQYHVVFDIDETLFYTYVDETTPGAFKLADGDYYVPTKWAREVITALYEDPRVRISFYSGGGNERNIKLLNQFKLVDSEQTYADIAYKILGKNDLAEINPKPNSEYFPDLYKKDLRRITLDLENVILVEDIKDFVIPSQRQNVLWNGLTFYYNKSFKEVKEKLGKGLTDYMPSNHLEWYAERHRLALAYEYILRAMDKADNDGFTFVEALDKVMTGKSGKTLFRDDIEAMKLLHFGIKKLHKYNSCNRKLEKATGPE